MSIMSSKVLKLNKSYVPIEIVTVREAFEMLYSDRAEVVSVEEGSYVSYDFDSWAEISELKHQLDEFEDVDDVIFTAFLTLQVPRVVRSLNFNKPLQHKVRLSRKNIYLRDNNTCQYCGRNFATNELTIDHIVPRSRGGKNTWKNLVCACFKCNQKKAGRTPQEAHMRLLSTPREPKHNFNIQFKIEDNKYSSWMHFISNAYWNTSLKDD